MSDFDLFAVGVFIALALQKLALSIYRLLEHRQGIRRIAGGGASDLLRERSA
jgi:hypothetical protein